MLTKLGPKIFLYLSQIEACEAFLKYSKVFLNDIIPFLLIPGENDTNIKYAIIIDQLSQGLKFTRLQLGGT